MSRAGASTLKYQYCRVTKYIILFYYGFLRYKDLTCCVRDLELALLSKVKYY